MRKLTKKIIVAVLSLAMVMGVMSIPTFAAPTSTTDIVIYLSEELGANEKLVLDIDGQAPGTGISCDVAGQNYLGWGRNMYEFTKDSSNPKKYTIRLNTPNEVNGTNWINFQFIIIKSSDSNYTNRLAVKYKPQTTESAIGIFNNNATVYYTWDLGGSVPNWYENTHNDVTNVDPATLTDEAIAAAAETKMEEALALEANLDNETAYDLAKGAYDALTATQKELVDSTLYPQITTALATIADIKANAAGDLTIYVTTEEQWTNLALYGWYDGGVKLEGNWPGKVLSADAKNPTYKVYNGTLTKPVNIKFNANGGKESASKYFVKGTYWVNIDGNNGLNVSTTKPANWVENTEEPTTAAENETTTAADNKATTAADNKTTTAADNKTTTAAADNTTTVADNGGAGAGEAESTTGAGGSSTDVGASDSSVVIFAVLAVVAIMGAAMVFVKKKSQEA